MELCGGLRSDTAETNVHSMRGFRNLSGVTRNIDPG